MRRLRGNDLAIGIEGELARTNRGMMRLFRGVRRNHWGKMLLDRKLEDLAADRGFRDIVGPDDGVVLADGAFMERLKEMLQWLFSPEGLESLKAFLDIVIALITTLVKLFAEGSPERKAMELEMAELEEISAGIVVGTSSPEGIVSSS